MEAPWALRGLRPRPGRLPSLHCPSGRGPGAGPSASRGARGLRRGHALTRGLGARARHRPGGEGAGALLRAQEGGGGERHSEEPAAGASRHRQRGQRLQPLRRGARAWTRRGPSSHTCRAATRRRWSAPPPGRSPVSAGGPAPAPGSLGETPPPFCSLVSQRPRGAGSRWSLEAWQAAGWGAC